MYRYGPDVLSRKRNRPAVPEAVAEGGSDATHGVPVVHKPGRDERTAYPTGTGPTR